jgi:hypothetical protein
MRTEPCIAVCRCYEKGHRKALLSQMSGNFCPKSAAKLDGKNRRFYPSDQIEDFFGLPRRRAKAARYAASNMACVRLFPNLWRAYS